MRENILTIFRMIFFLIVVIILTLLIKCCLDFRTAEEEEIEQSISVNQLENDTLIYIVPFKEPLPLYINQDSIDRVELVKDSIQFRKITKIINGGYNGFAERYAMWLRARNASKEQKKEEEI